MSTPMLVHLSEYLCKMYHFYRPDPSNFKNLIQFVTKFMHFFVKTQVTSNDIELNITISIRCTNCHITCSKFPSFADTYACSQLRLPFTTLSTAFSGKAEQIN